MRGSRAKPMTFDRFRQLAEMNVEACCRFLKAWEQLGTQGQCDAPRGAEFNRVFLEYLMANKPPNAADFIRQRANLPSPGDDAPPAAGSEVQP